MKTIPILVMLALPALAFAQAPRFDIKPVAAAAIGVTLDTGSTHLAIPNGCVETTALFTQAPYSPSRPNFKKMWRMDAIGVGGVLAMNLGAHVLRRQHPRSTPIKALSFVVKSASYSAGAWRGYHGARNLARCGG